MAAYEGERYREYTEGAGQEYLRQYSSYKGGGGGGAPSSNVSLNTSLQQAPPSPARVPTYPRHTVDPASEKPAVSPSRARTLEGAANYESLRAAYPSYTGPATREDPQAAAVREVVARRGSAAGQPQPSSPYRRRTTVQAQSAKAARSISPPTTREVDARALEQQLQAQQQQGVPVPAAAALSIAPPRKSSDSSPHIDLTAWRMRLNALSGHELKQLISNTYDRNYSGSIDFCDFLALWFSQQLFQIRRSGANVGPDGKETETFEVQAKHIYRVREIFNEYEESYLSGIRYGLVSAMLKDLMYDQDHEVQHYYGIGTEDMVSLVEELSLHRQPKGAGQHAKEPRYDFAYILQLLFKYITDNEEIALFYDEGCKVFQALRTKEYGEQPIYQNSTISTKLLVKLLSSYQKKTEDSLDIQQYESGHDM